MDRGNIEADIPDASGEEVFELLSTMAGGARIERIVSEGQSSPPGFWYDQAWDEWVLLLRGGAELEFDNPADVATLSRGDWLLIPARRRHRVRATEAGTLWLAVHGGPL